MVLDVNVLTSGWTIAGVIASFFVAAIALFLGMRSSWQLNKIRKDEKKERLLNEIIEWAVDASTRRSPIDILKNAEWVLGNNPDSEEKFRFLQIYGFADLMQEYAVLNLRGEYISRIASSIRKDLGEAVDDLINKIEKLINVLFDGVNHAVKLEEYETIIDIIFRRKSELRDGLSEDAKSQLSIFDSRTELSKSTTRVIELATKIKTKDIS